MAENESYGYISDHLLKQAYQVPHARTLAAALLMGRAHGRGGDGSRSTNPATCYRAAAAARQVFGEGLSDSAWSDARAKLCRVPLVDAEGRPVLDAEGRPVPWFVKVKEGAPGRAAEYVDNLFALVNGLDLTPAPAGSGGEAGAAADGIAPELLRQARAGTLDADSLTPAQREALGEVMRRNGR